MVEVLVSIVVLAVAAAGVAHGLAFTSAALGTARVQSIATGLATSVLEDVRATEYVALGTVGGDPAGDIVPDRTETVDGIAFRIQTAVEVVDEPTLDQAAGGADYKRVTVRVTPQVPGGKTFTESTILSPPAGQTYIAVTVRDPYDDGPVAGVTVTMSLDGVDTSQTTPASGQVIFPGLEPGQATLTVSKPGYVSDASDRPDALQRTLRAGEAWQPTIWMYTPITVVAEVVDDQTDAAPTTPVTVALTTPGGGQASLVGTGGTFTFTEVAIDGSAQPIAPSAAPVTIVAVAACAAAQVSGPAPAEGYPAVTSETFQLRLSSPPHGELRLSLRTGSGSAIAGAAIQVSGGDAGVQRTLTTDAAGAAFACLPPSGGSPYALSANVDGYVARGEFALALGGAATLELVQPGSIAIYHGLLAGTPIRIRQGSTVVRQGTTSGLLLGVGVEFHEVSPGSYTAERWIQPLLGDGYWGGAKTVAVESGAFLSYTL